MMFIVTFWSLSLILISQTLKIRNFEHLQQAIFQTPITPSNLNQAVIYNNISHTIIPVDNPLNFSQLMEKKTQQAFKQEQKGQSQNVSSSKQNIQKQIKSQSTKSQVNQTKQNKSFKKPSSSSNLQEQQDQKSKSEQGKLKYSEKQKIMQKQTIKEQKPAPLPVPGIDIQQKPKQQTNKESNIESPKQTKQTQKKDEIKEKIQQKQVQKEQIIKNQPQKQQKQYKKTSIDTLQWSKKDQQQFEQWKKNLIPVSDPKLKEDYNKLIQKQKQRRLIEKKKKKEGK